MKATLSTPATPPEQPSYPGLCVFQVVASYRLALFGEMRRILTTLLTLNS